MTLLLQFFLLFWLPVAAFSQERIVNVYAWTGEVPDSIVRQFEKETGIKVNFSTYENNEIMYAKLRASSGASYDVVMPSSYFVDRMRKQDMLLTLDKTKLPNWHHLNPSFLHPSYDPNTEFSTPYIWGITGIFYNTRYFPNHTIKSWSDLWDKRFYDRLMLLDDMREVFSMALLTLGYPVNDTNPEHIKQAFLKLKTLAKNVKVFSTETVVSIIIDEDATVGMAWNGDTYKAMQENPNVQFTFPTDGFIIWVDNFSIPKHARHQAEAYEFINFMMRPDIAKAVALITNFPITNLSGQQMLPEKVRNNPVIYPSKEVLKRGQFQTDIGEETLNLLEKYWEELKISG